MESNRNLGRGIIGIVLILIGIAFIGRTLDIFPHQITHHLFSFPTILIVIGVVIILAGRNKTSGWILLIIGLVFLIPDVIHVPYSIRRLFWPTILIIVGLLIIFRSSGVRRSSEESSSSDYIDDIAILGGGDRVITSENFKGGKITSIFGGSKIDLRKATLAPGQNIIDMFCMFGGSTLKVPASWNIKIDVVSLFGGFSDKRHIKTETTMDVGKELIIKGFVMFGGGELKN
ncbi:LiaI-LiaF-like domain-containing protein [Bacteroidota bacterium]